MDLKTFNLQTFHPYARMTYHSGKPFEDFERLPKTVLTHLPEEAIVGESERTGRKLPEIYFTRDFLDSKAASKIDERIKTGEYDVISNDLGVLAQAKRIINVQYPRLVLADILWENMITKEADLTAYLGPREDPRVSDLPAPVRRASIRCTDKQVEAALTRYLTFLKQNGVRVEPDTGHTDLFQLTERIMGEVSPA